MNLRDRNIQKILLGVGVLLVLSYFYFATSFLPFCYPVMKAQIAELEAEDQKLSAELEKARQTVGKLAQLEAEYQRLHGQWMSAQELLPEEEEMPELLRKVTMAGNRAGIDFVLFQPLAPVVQEVFKSHPIKVQVRGGFHNLGIFLSRLANMERIVNVTDLTVNTTSRARRGKGKGKVKQNTKDTVVADFTLTAYTMIGGTEDEVAVSQAQQEEQPQAQ